jgi:hypothetical protein
MTQQQNDLRAKLYHKYLAAQSAAPFEGKIMPYGWGELPKPLHFTWMAYDQMFQEFSIEIANALNQLTNHLHRLRAWDLVLPSLNDDERMEALIEFIDSTATVALLLPYTIRSQFIFAITHLCHQANQAVLGFQWVDDLPGDNKIGFKEAEKYGRSWSAYPRCRAAFEKIFKGNFEGETLHFRHAYNHRFAPRVLMGISGLVVRKRNPAGGMQYVWGYNQPLGLKGIADALFAQCIHCYTAFEAFQELIREHEAIISSRNQQLLAAS